jgi:CRP/FNR family transcriptional regulator, cyclic AMP receptor protein
MAKNIRDNLLFHGVDAATIEKFLSSLPPPEHLKKGQFLWRQNDPGHSMYLLKSGGLEVLIAKAPGESETVIAHIEAGAVIGEVCVFGEKFRSASIRASEDAELLQIDGEAFIRKVHERDPAALLMSYNVARLLTQRLIMANDFIRNLQQIQDKAVVKSEVEHYRERFFQESLFN